MKNTVNELQSIIDDYVLRLDQLSEAEFAAKPSATKWSKKEIVGHLIDSAQNNLRRFICSQYEATPPRILYDQNFWVTINDYQRMNKEDIILLWKLLNERICAVCSATSEDRYSSLCDTGRETPELHTIGWLAADYVKHLKHHINQIFPKSFDVIYA